MNPRCIIRLRLISMLAVTFALVVAAGQPARASTPKGWSPRPKSDTLDKATLTQRLDHQIPVDLQFRNSKGDTVELSKYLDGDRPVVLALGYVQCPNLCTLVHESMVQSLKKITSLNMGEDYQVLSVSIDPNEPLDLTRSARQRYLQMYARDGAAGGWHSLVGDKDAISRLSKAIGFSYAYDAKKDEYSHPAALVVLTPEGTVSRYFYGLDYDPRDVKLGLVDASSGTIGSPVDKVLLRCCSYDPKTGKYSVQIMNVMRLAGGVTVVLLAVGLLVAVKRNRGDDDNLPEARS